MSEISNQFKFVGKISKMGDNRIIWIPKEFHGYLESMMGKQVKIVLTDDI
ncbi:MAG: hypothetical protein ACE5J2_01875 [Nitrososphaerales archaeon]